MSWRYRFADLLSDVDVADVGLTGVTMDQRIIQPGSLQATIPVPNRRIADQVRTLIPDPTTGIPQTICHVYRNADLWGSYIIWSTSVEMADGGAISIGIQGATLESWFYHRLLDTDLSYTATDQLDIARDILTRAQAGRAPWAANANLGIALQAGTSNVPRDREYRLSEAAMTGQRVEELANVENGFEYRIVTFADPTTGQRHRLWTWGYPTLGRDDPTQLYSLPGNLRTLKVANDSTNAGTAFWGRGDTIQDDLTEDSEPVIMQAPVTRDDLLSHGWPWLDSVSDHQGVTETPTLEAYASWYAAVSGGAVRTLSATVRVPENEVGFLPNRLGDRARLVVVNDWFPMVNGAPTMSISPRVVGVSMTPASRDSGQDIQELIFADDQSRAPQVEEA